MVLAPVASGLSGRSQASVISFGVLSSYWLTVGNRHVDQRTCRKSQLIQSQSWSLKVYPEILSQRPHQT